MGKRILIIEDEKNIVDILVFNLSREGYDTLEAYDGEAGLQLALEQDPDLILLDLMLPKRNGFDVCRAIREQGRATPILMLTARDDVSDKISGLDCGADDYMTKPFDTGELMARVRALTRRQGEVLSDVLTVNDLSLDCTSRLLSAGERSVRLGFKEFEVLRLLMVNNGNVVTKETLISKIWGLDSEAEDNNVEVYISFLRKKLVFLNSQVSISTVRKVGYFLDTPQK